MNERLRPEFLQFGLESLEETVPMPSSGTEDHTTHDVYPHPQFVPVLLAMIEHKHDQLWEELLLHFYRQELILPGIIDRPILQQIEKEKINFFDVSSFIPQSRRGLLSEKQRQLIELPEGAFNDLSAFQQLRFIKKNYVANKEIQEDQQAQFWKKASKALQSQFLLWLFKVPVETQLISLNTLASKSNVIKRKIDQLYFHSKNGAYQSHCEKCLDESINAENENALTICLYPLDIFPKERFITMISASSRSIKQLQIWIQACLFHNDLSLASRIVKSQPSVLMGSIEDMPFLQHTCSESWCNFLFQQKTHPSWILHTLLSNDHFWSPTLSRKLTAWLDQQQLNSDNFEILVSIVQLLSIKGDPTVLSSMIHFKEKHHFLDKKSLKMIQQSVHRLQLRLQYRKLIHNLSRS